MLVKMNEMKTSMMKNMKMNKMTKMNIILILEFLWYLFFPFVSLWSRFNPRLVALDPMDPHGPPGPWVARCCWTMGRHVQLVPTITLISLLLQLSSLCYTCSVLLCFVPSSIASNLFRSVYVLQGYLQDHRIHFPAAFSE